MSKINIVLKGLALCYHKTDADEKVRWRVIFPFDEREHRIWFSWRRTGGAESEPIPLASARRVLRLVAEDAKEQQQPSHPSFERFVDANELHDRVKPIDGWENSGVRMFIDDAVFSSVKDSDRDFYITLRQLPFPFPPFGRRKGRVGEIVGAEIDLNRDGSNVKFFVDDEVYKEFPYAPGVNYELKFDNDCDSRGACDGHTDFPQYYQVIEDADDNFLQFDLRGEILPFDLIKAEELFSTPNGKNKKNILELGNPLILCGGLRVEHPGMLP